MLVKVSGSYRYKLHNPPPNPLANSCVSAPSNGREPMGETDSRPKSPLFSALRRGWPSRASIFPALAQALQSNYFWIPER